MFFIVNSKKYINRFSYVSPVSLSQFDFVADTKKPVIKPAIFLCFGF